MPTFRLIAIAAMVGLYVAAATPARAVDWVMPPAGYVAEAVPGCPALGARERHYRVCEDQMAVLAEAIARAKSANRMLVVHFGATWCPLCKVLEQRVAKSRTPGAGVPALLPAEAEVVSIAVSTIAGGRRVDVASGQAALRLVLDRAKGPALRAVPYFAAINPGDAGRAFSRNLDDLERSGSFDFAAFSAMASAAVVHVHSGGPAPTEPGPVWRRLMRWYHKIVG